MQAVVFQKDLYITLIARISPGKERTKIAEEIAQLSQQFSGQKKVYIAIGDDETIVANLWEKYRDLSYLCRWGRKKGYGCRLTISKNWKNIVKKRWEN